MALSIFRLEKDSDYSTTRGTKRNNICLSTTVVDQVICLCSTRLSNSKRLNSRRFTFFLYCYFDRLSYMLQFLNITLKQCAIYFIYWNTTKTPAICRMLSIITNYIYRIFGNYYVYIHIVIFRSMSHFLLINI